MPVLKPGRSSKVPNDVNRGMEGNHVLNPAGRGKLVFPDWKTKVPSIFRIVPTVYESDDGSLQFIPHRDSAGPEGLTNFFVRLPTVSMIGSAPVKQTFNLSDPGDESIDFNSLPYVMLYNKLRLIAKAKQSVNMCGRRVTYQEIAMMFGSETDQDAKVLQSPSKMTTYVQVLPYWSKDADQREKGLPPGARSGDFAHYVMLKTSAAKGLEAALEASGSGSKCRDPLLAAYDCGDVTALDQRGQFLVVYNPDEHNFSHLTAPQRVLRNDSDVMEDTGGNQASKAGSAFGKGYAAGFVRNPLVPGPTGVPMKLSTKWLEDASVQENILQNYKNLHNNFMISDPDTQAVYCAKAFSDDEHKHIVRYVFEGTPFWNNDTKAILAGRISRSVPGNTQTESLPKPRVRPPREEVVNDYDEQYAEDAYTADELLPPAEDGYGEEYDVDNYDDTGAVAEAGYEEEDYSYEDASLTDEYGDEIASDSAASYEDDSSFTSFTDDVEDELRAVARRGETQAVESYDAEDSYADTADDYGDAVDDYGDYGDEAGSLDSDELDDQVNGILEQLEEPAPAKRSRPAPPVSPKPATRPPGRPATRPAARPPAAPAPAANTPRPVKPAAGTARPANRPQPGKPQPGKPRPAGSPPAGKASKPGPSGQPRRRPPQ